MTFENARQYLARVVPWPQDGDAPFYVNVHWTAQSPNYPKPFWSGRATRSVDEAARAIEWALKLPETRDVYLCLSAQSQCTTKTSKTGRPYMLPVRTQENVVGLKSLFLDIDVKDKGYPDVTSAVTALKQFITDTSMPGPSLIVGSGSGGLHVYWTMVRALPRHEWQPLADALAEATRRHGLKCDTACTVDSARILRVPDTFNRKSEPPKPVRLLGTPRDYDYTVERINQALQSYVTASATPALSLPPRPPLQGISDLAAGVEQTKAEPVDLDDVAHTCGLLKEAIDTGGAGFQQPLWNLTTLAAVFSKGGRADAHRMADKHPGYTQQSTDDLFDRKEREHQQKNLGWPSCMSFENAGSTHCATCKHKSAGKSPLAYRTPVTPQVTKSDLPTGYVRDAAGRVCRIIKDEQGNDRLDLICDYPMLEPRLTKDPWTINFTTRTPGGGERQVSITAEAANAKDALPRAFGKFGIGLLERQIKPAREFFVAWLKTLQEARDSVVASDAFGWNVKRGSIEGFVFDGQVWMPGSQRPASNADPVLARQYKPTGELKAWTDAAKMITDQKRPELDAIIATAFGAPLVHFTGHEGAFISVYSPESGIGKTTSLKVAQAVWGDPVRGMQGLTDTVNSVINKIGQIKSLPLYWDELKTEEDTKRFLGLIFQLTGGKEKSRLNADSSQRDMGTWQTMLISASNESLLDHVSAKSKNNVAGIMRVFEYVVKPSTTGVGQISPAVAQRLVAKLNDNYGQVGAAYARYLGSNFKTLDKEFAAFQTDLYNDCKFEKDERFWNTAVTCVLFGAKLSNRLGFTTIDETALKVFMVDVLKNMREIRRDSHVDMKNKINVASILTQFFSEMRARNTLVTDRIHVGAGKPPPNSVKVLNNTVMLDLINSQVGINDKLVRINCYQFNKWLQKEEQPRNGFYNALKEAFGYDIVVGRIGSGTPMKLGTDRLIQIDLSGTVLEGLVDDMGDEEDTKSTP